MQFSKLRLTGFKSFVDPTDLMIEPGLTGIVGPNGCGKSNLVEALRWAMGETSAKRLRGGEMDDVIFGGTGTRPARNVAEVGLHLDNANHRAPALYNEHSEIEIVRRIERGAGSAYRINGKEVRARDVQLLFADLATGAHSTAMVSQGRIGWIIGAKPIERRALLEEAAGISGLHARRHEAELRLKAAEANLTRLDDIIRTQEEQLEALKKQARQAGRYRRLSDHIRRAEAMVLHLRWLRANAELEAAVERLHAVEGQVGELTMSALAAERAREQAAGVLPGLRQSEAAASAELQRLTLARQTLEDEERRVTEARAVAEGRLDQIAQDRAREAALAADAHAALETLEAERRDLTAAQGSEAGEQAAATDALRLTSGEVTGLDAEIETLTQQVAALEARREALLREAQDMAARRARLAERSAELDRQRVALGAEALPSGIVESALALVTAAEAEMARASAAADAAEQALRSAETVEQTARTPSEAAQSQRQKLDTEAQALQELLAATASSHAAPLIDAVRVETGFEAALGAALGEDLTAPLDPTAPIHWTTLPPYEVTAGLPNGVESLAAHVAAPPVLSRRLGQIGLVPDAATAERLRERLRPGQRLVSRDGRLWRWDGLTRAGDTPTSAGQRLRQRNRLTEIAEQLTSAAHGVEETGRVLETARADVVTASIAAREARAAVQDAVRTLAVMRERHAVYVQRQAETNTRLASLNETATQVAADLAEAETRESIARETLATLQSPAIARDRAAALRLTLGDKRRTQATQQSEVDRLAHAATARRTRLELIGVEQNSWRERAEAAARQQAALEERRLALTQEIEALLRKPAELTRQREALAESIARAGAKRGQAGDALASAETHLAETEKAAKAAEAQLAAAREERVRAEGVRDQASHGCDEVAARVAERLGTTPDRVPEVAEIEPDEALPELAHAETRLERLVRERDNMGPVNLVAEAEANELEQRVSSLKTEREDLLQAIARLRQGINALNREGRERLIAAFARVNEHFQGLFVRLFGGGRAHLELREPEEGGENKDPLESGLEIMASPPGKRLQSLSLLSGGEQALTALALLFAVFLTNPAPICVLDEVDAPLDDANVDRFCRLVEEIAQSALTRFLIITHHRITMARMDRLFGVTMAERGISQLVSVDLQAAEQLRETA
ncbi:MAG TPA: chromosome segregation protein SMC [Stellaceae bacterium]|nr:chromosome segregation protein SMC [Stellaceae bacterium]